MKITIIIGSHRSKSQSEKVGNYLLHRIKELGVFQECFILNLAETDIPFWDEGAKIPDTKWINVWKPIEAELQSSDAYIIISPEYGGMVPARLKNLFLLCKSPVMGHKPALIVSVSSGTGGAYPISELRASSYKNTKICYLPEHIIIRKVEEVLNDVKAVQSEDDERIRKRINHTLEMLEKYAEAFSTFKKKNFDFHKFPNGM
jgi:NAD(P)H-dependent FMN reductase